MNLPQNVGDKDRNIRFGIAGILVLAGIATNTPIFTILGIAVLVTAAVGTCFAYIPLNINTKKEGEG